MRKNVKLVEWSISMATVFLNMQTLKKISQNANCFFCNKSYQRKFHEKLNEKFFNSSNLDNNKFILSLWKGVYPYEFMDDWEKFNETSLCEKENVYSHLNMEDTIDGDYAYVKRVCKDFEKKKKKK